MSGTSLDTLCEVHQIGFYSELAAANKVVLVTSLFEKRAPGLYHNTAVVFDRDGSIAGKYRKMHIPDDPAYYEKFYFTPGDIGFEPIQTSLGKLGVLVCWDQCSPADRFRLVPEIPLVVLLQNCFPKIRYRLSVRKDQPENMIVEIDMERSENVRRWWPFLRDRRIDEYDGLTKRFLD